MRWEWVRERARLDLAARVESWSALGTATTARRTASAGVSLLIVVGLAIALTLPLLSARPVAWTVLAVYLVLAASLTAITRTRWWQNAPRRMALAFPALVFLATGAVATASPGAGVAYAAFFTLGFAWTGLFAPASSGRVLLLLAWPAYAQTLPAAVEFTVPAAVRLFFLTALWLSLSEVLGALMERERSRQLALRRASETDPLTGLLNRRAIAPALAALRAGDSVALLDLDHFKALNDTLGHAAGDDTLAALGHHLRTHLRAGDSVARWGGEEFLVLLPATHLDDAFAIVDRLRSRWSAQQTTTFSAGVAEHPPGHPLAAHQVIAAADSALYAAKDAGRDQVHRGPTRSSRPLAQEARPVEGPADASFVS